ncbi:MAG: hypothetical protein AABZ14_08670 [Candidatus Margulisiibacteriota bacterium]
MNGHTVNKEGKIKSFHNGKLLCIDAGFSEELVDLGMMVIITTTNKIYSLSLSNNHRKIPKWTLQELEGNELVTIG